MLVLFVLNYLTKNQDPPDWTISDIWALVSFISVAILLAKPFLILVVCLVDRNNSCGNSSFKAFLLYS